MNDALTALPDFGASLVRYLVVFGLASLRLMMILYIFPPSADGVMQGIVRNGVAMVFCSFIAYGQPVAQLGALNGVGLIETVLREAIIGVVLGFAASTVFWVAESAGTYIDDLTGYNSVQVNNPLRDEQSTPTGTLLAQVASVAFWTFGGMMFLLNVLYESYHWWPLLSNAPVGPSVLESFVLRQTDSLMQTVAKLAAPMVFILLLIDFAFGLIAKSAPKLDLMTLSQPVKGALTVLMLALFAGMFIDQVRDQLMLTTLGDQLRAFADASRK
jgi:type III secretion protein T